MNTTPVSLLERLRTQPDDESWRRLVDLYRSFIERWLRQAGVRASDIDDVSQDVLATLVKKIPEFVHSGRTGAFRQWLRLTVFNHVLWYRRSGKSAVPSGSDDWLCQLEDPQSDLARLWDSEHDSYVVQRMLAMLSPEFTKTTWLAFRRVVLESTPVAEAAAELGISVNAVLIAKSRILRRLREEAGGLID